MGGFRGGQGGCGPHFFSCIFKKFLTSSLMFGHKCSQNDVKQHHQFLRPPLSGFSGSAPVNNVLFSAWAQVMAQPPSLNRVYQAVSLQAAVFIVMQALYCFEVSSPCHHHHHLTERPSPKKARTGAHEIAL